MKKSKEFEYEKVDLDQLFYRSDFITLHVPLTQETRNILSEDNIKVKEEC